MSPSTPLALMRQYGADTQAALLKFLPDREPKRYLYDLIRDYPKRGGRFMRPALHIASAKAHGATQQQAMATAMCVELLHNAMLVIDDIQDDSEERRGLPTLHRSHGVPLALNVGSTMSVLSLVPLLQNISTSGPFVAHWIFEEATRVAQSCAEGQAMELGWRADNEMNIDEAAYLDMVLRKTCAYSTIFPIRTGVMVGHKRRQVPPSVDRFAYLVGAAFQIQDDLLNLVGDPIRYGKELLGDLFEGKRTLITIALVERCTSDERRRVADVLGQPRASKRREDVDWLMGLILRYECIRDVRAKLNALVGAALHEFELAFGGLPESPDKSLLRDLPHWVVRQT